MKLLRPTIALGLTLGSMVGVWSAQPTHAAVSTGRVSIQRVLSIGTTTVAALTANSTATINAAPRPTTHFAFVNRAIPRPARTANSRPIALPAAVSLGVSAAPTGTFGFAGLTERDQRLAGSGIYANTQQDLEPPDQGLCAGNGFVIDAVNLALEVYKTSGSPASAATPLNQFFKVPPVASNTNPTVFGPFLSDPKCYYDADTGRWFVTILSIPVDPATGNFVSTAPSFFFVAASQSNDPTGKWNLFAVDTTDDGTGGTPSNPACPCFGDQPLLGADKHGIYVSTNEFPIIGPGFNGSQVYAISKVALEAGTATVAVHINVGSLPTPDPNGIWYSLQPATSPGGVYETANGGTEYLMSAFDFNNTGDNRIAVWALTNTSSLATAKPNVGLAAVVIGTEPYIDRSVASGFSFSQRPGPTPLAGFFNFYFHTNNGLEPIQANDDRMNQVVFADGKLWSGVNTGLFGLGSFSSIGIAYFIVTPSDANGTLSAVMTKQGYVAAGRDNVVYPSIGVNTAGKGVMSFTLSGPDFYPSAAYAPIDATSGAAAIHIAGAGLLPEDGFTGYNSPLCPPQVCNNQTGARWGDYSAAVADENGNIWLAAEYIPLAPRLLLANWGTFISRVTP